ncbi:GAF and ANTAR domain-containing protein [Nakamurella flavida]|uniref:GAF and ANTAR domain-containing protein n=1 Tax=Nakamurella flavida TaxID=363630 RepID=A0A938YI44_9ACTN|nr:GAF and ANTAR domain-containing protein [Nakamurella flavida]MBM9475158.1 GAF and ANTAR domain-containing protein [Nakamurella flavida]MDP9776727.1 transcriptional regulator with GAF, ATPase, and Fis domain [Nakamurella flavida]
MDHAGRPEDLADHPADLDAQEGGADRAQQEAEQQDADLAASLSDLAALSTDRVGLVELLTKIATMAVQAIPGADGAGLTLLEPDRADIIVKSTDFVRQIDDIQYSIGQGPCISAAATGTAMRSGSLGGDPRWPRFGPRAGRLGVHSVLSLPLSTPSGVVGAMNVYAHAKDAFDERAEQLGEMFSVPAAISVLNAQILAQSQRLATQLQAALVSRPAIDQAVGILISRSGDTAEEAFLRLRQMSQNQHVKLTVVGQQIVAEAATRARARARARTRRPAE